MILSTRAQSLGKAITIFGLLIGEQTRGSTSQTFISVGAIG